MEHESYLVVRGFTCIFHNFQPALVKKTSEKLAYGKSSGMDEM